jgi:protein required for attachment to host cells
MQLPRELQHFPEPTLLVLADHVEGKFYLLGGDAMEEVGSVAVPAEKRSDKDTSFVDSDSGRVSGPEPKDDEDRVHHLLHALVEGIETLLHKHQATRLVLIMQNDLLHGVKSHLDADATARVWKEVPQDLMKQHPLEAVRRLFP